MHGHLKVIFCVRLTITHTRTYIYIYITFSRAVSPLCQYSYISTLPIQLYLHSANTAISPLCQYSYISTLPIQLFLHSANTAISPLYQYCYISTLPIQLYLHSANLSHRRRQRQYYFIVSEFISRRFLPFFIHDICLLPTNICFTAYWM